MTTIETISWSKKSGNIFFLLIRNDIIVIGNKLSLKIVGSVFSRNIFSWIFVFSNVSWNIIQTILEVCILVFSRKKLQFNSLVSSLVKSLISRIFCQKSVRVKFRNFYTVETLPHHSEMMIIFKCKCTTTEILAMLRIYTSF